MKKFCYLSITLLLTLPVLHVQAQEVDILWQGKTYTHPFYKGRALWADQSKITFVAIPHDLGTSSNLNYKWIKNGTVLGNINGVGKNSVNFVDSLSRTQNVKIEIISSNKDVLASASTETTPISPSLIIYENNPLYGYMFHKEVSKVFKLQEREVTFTAFPFYFSALSRADDTLNYKWRTNTGEIETKNSVTYRTSEGATGTSKIQVQTSDKNKYAQIGKNDFLIEFENK